MTTNDLIRLQQSSCAALAVILERAAEEIGKLDLPAGDPARGYGQVDIVATLLDMMPTQTVQEMEAALEVTPDEVAFNLVGFWNEFQRSVV